MRMILATASLALLAACGGGAANNSSADGGAPANGAGAAPTDPELASIRARGIAGCSAEVTLRLAPGTDAARLCGCAVDRLMAGRTAAQLRAAGSSEEQAALVACAAEQGVAMGGTPGTPAAPAAPATPAAGAGRENEMRECADDVRSELPAGTDLNAFCGCAVDKMQTGLRERDAMNQCAAQMGVRPNN
jgi:hypothetical protein